jgi:SAM-dependent methyltransferase
MFYRVFFIAIVAIGFLSCKPAVEHQHNADRESDETVQSPGFDELSSEYYESQSRVIWQKPELVLSLLGDLRGKTVADIGAGTGFFSFRIANQGAKVIAIDVDPRAIAWIDGEKTRYPIEVQSLLQTRLADSNNPNLGPAEVDVVLMVNTYIYLSDRIQYFKGLRDGLKRGAEIIIIDFKDEDTPLGPSPEERVSVNQVQSELASAGYRIIMTDEDALQYQYIIKATMR